MYISKATGNEFLSCIGEVLDQHDSLELQNKCFTIMADEGTNINKTMFQN